MNSEFLRRSWLVCGAVLVGVVCSIAPSAFAQKGGSGSTGGGTIFYIDAGVRPTNYTWSMNSDGSNKTELGWFGLFDVPSRAFHGGHRYFLTALTIPDEYYPDGTTRRAEVFAIRDDYSTLNNNGDTKIQLTNDPTLQPAFSWFQGMHWLPGDGSISFKARRWDGATPVEGGLYVADIAYGAEGNVVGLVSQPTTPALSFALDANGWPAFGRHSWGLSTTQVAYIDSPETGMWLADITTGARTRIYSGGVGYLDWSQDGTKIVFGSGTIRTIKPNGTTLRTVLGPRHVNGVWVSGFGHAYFSPTGSHITCVGIMNLAGGGQDNDVIRCTATGGSVANLTNTTSINEIPIAWE